MRTKNSRFWIVLGILVGALVVAVALPRTSAGDRVNQVFANFLKDLGLLRSRRCCGSPRNGCIANLKQIDGATATWALENKKAATDIPTPTELYGTNAYIREEPECPIGGKYVMGSGQQKPRCSVPGHTL